MTEKSGGPSLVKDFFEGKSVSRPPFILWSTSLGPRVVKRTVMDQLSDPNLIATNVSQCFNLFSPDAIVTGFPLQFPIAACEVSANPISVSLDKDNRMYEAVLEGIKRVGLTLKNRVALSVSIPGPVTFMEQIRQSLSIPSEDHGATDDVFDNITEVMSKLTSSILEHDISIIAIVESLESFNEIADRNLERVAQVLDTLSNIVSYHNKYTILVINDIPLETDLLKDLETFNQINGFLVHHNSCPEVFELPVAVGTTTPDGIFDEKKDLKQNSEAQKEFLKEFSQRTSSFFLSTSQEIADTSSFAALRAFGEVVRGQGQA
jgi:hypothetical protein